MKQEQNTNEESLAKRTKVAKSARFTKYKDKLLLMALMLICLGIVLAGFMPKRKTKTLVEESYKESTSQQLDQNLALIAAMKADEASQRHKDNSLNHPPTLREHIFGDEGLSKETLARMNAPSTFFSTNGDRASNAVISGNKTQSKTLLGRDANSDFLNQQNDITTVNAKRLPHPRLTVPAGEMIPATLETAINSELAGMVRAITTRDVYALSGDKVLIPKGTTLVGQFNTAITQGQNRIFVVWNRLQMTNGLIASLNSPSTDSIGRAGLAADYINRHFFERFGTGTLLSVLGAYTATGGVGARDEYNSLSQYRTNIAGGFQQAANQTLQQDMQNSPTLQVNQGATINIFVAHDLDFYRVSRA